MTTRVSPIKLVDIVLAVLCFVVLYDSATGFEQSLSLYHAGVAHQLLLFSLLMLLPHIVLGFPSPDFRVDGAAWGALIVVLLVSTYMAESAAATEKLRLLFSMFAFGVALRCWLRVASVNVVPVVLLAISLFHSAILILVFQSVPGANLSQPHDHSWVPYHSHIRHFSYHGMVASCAGISLAFLDNRLRMVGFLLGAFALTGIFFFGARGALLGWLVFVATYALTSKRYLGILLLSAVTAGIAMSLAYALSMYIAQSPFTGGIHSRVESIETLVHTTGRIEIWQDAIKAAMQHPWFGWGLDGYRMSNCCLYGTVQPHNVLVQWVVEFGVIGASVVLGACWWIVGKRLTHVITSGGSNPNLAALLSVSNGFFAFGLVDGLFYHVIPLLLLAILCALLYQSLDAEASILNGNAVSPDAGQ